MSDWDETGNDSDKRWSGGQFEPSNRGRGWLILLGLAAIFGAVMAGISTRDFISHLDGQVHAVSCSVMPGGEAVIGASGCKEAMLSPWSSFFRTKYWGGLPVALLGFAVFAFIGALAFAVAFSKQITRRDTGFVLLASLVPVGASAIWGTLAATRLGEFCQVCVGMYVASGLMFVLAVVSHFRASPGSGAWPWGRFGLWFVEGLVAVGLLSGVYAMRAPDERKSLDGCGALVSPEDPKGVLLTFPGQGTTPALAVLDPLCPACRSFDERLKLSELDQRLAMKVLLFPLDSTCNWMVKTSLHPGACQVSEAMLCSPAEAEKILAWSFENQEHLLELGAKDAKALTDEITTRWPAAKGCVGTSRSKDKITSGLRWAVENALPVLTPQLYVAGKRMCDEDTDLGLEFTLHHMIEQHANPTAGGR
ncbi:MAG: vitamin K epoxide reductase family protein [Myxococcota bacterium]